jgi:hypothetical protein
MPADGAVRPSFPEEIYSMSDSESRCLSNLAPQFIDMH